MNSNRPDSEYVYGVVKEDFNYLKSEQEEGLKSEEVVSKDHSLLLAVGFIPFILSTLWFISQ
jgi:hypothetical protein